MIMTTDPTPEGKQFLADPEGTSVRTGDVEPMEGMPLADAEEEEFVQLWAADPGNQGA